MLSTIPSNIVLSTVLFWHIVNSDKFFFLHRHQYKSALNYFQQATQFYAIHAPEDFWELALCHQWMAMTCVQIGDDQHVLHHGCQTINSLLKLDVSKPLTSLFGSNLPFFKNINSFKQANQDAAREQIKNQIVSETYR